MHNQNQIKIFATSSKKDTLEIAGRDTFQNYITCFAIEIHIFKHDLTFELLIFH